MEMSLSKMETATSRQSSTGSSDSTPSTAATNSTQISDDFVNDALLGFLCRCLKIRDKNHHPFSTLLELQQKGRLTKVEYHDRGQVAGTWMAGVSIQCGENGHHFGVECVAGSKKAAKTKAAEDVIEKVLMYNIPDQIDNLASNKTASLPDNVPNHTNSRASNEPTSSPDNVPNHINSHAPNEPTSSPPIALPGPSSLALSKRQTRVLAEAQLHFDRFRAVAEQRRAGVEDFLMLAVDVEKNPWGPEILEVGLAYILASESCVAPAIHTFHIIVSDHLSIHSNLPDYDQRDNFNFGTSECVTLKDLPDRIRVIIDGAAQGLSVTLLGHSVHNDVAWLGNAGVVIDLPVCDLAKIYQAQQQTIWVTGLQKMMDALAVDYKNLHNAGNDAFYTLETGLKMIDRLQPVVEDAGRDSFLIWLKERLLIVDV